MVSIAITTYNGEKYLKEQLQSVVNQSFRDLEIIIVDDNSTDDTIDIVNDFEKQDKRIKLYKNTQRLGFFPNLLKAASLCNGEYICICDQDDVWREDKVEILKHILDSDSKIMLVYSDLEVCDENLECIHPSFFEFRGIRPRKGYLRGLSILKNIVPGVAIMLRKEVKDMLVRVSADAPFIHDHLSLIFASGLGKISYIKQKTIKYRQHSGNILGAFRASDIDKDSIIRELIRKIEYFKKASFKLPEIDLDRMSRFCKCLQNGNLLERLSFIDCYLFLRKDRIADKFLAFMECLFPVLYKRLLRIKKKAPPKIIYLWFKRIIFTTWAIIVLFYFTKEFIAYKIIKFIGYLHA